MDLITGKTSYLVLSFLIYCLSLPTRIWSLWRKGICLSYIATISVPEYPNFLNDYMHERGEIYNDKNNNSVTEHYIHGYNMYLPTKNVY